MHIECSLVSRTLQRLNKRLFLLPFSPDPATELIIVANTGKYPIIYISFQMSFAYAFAYSFPTFPSSSVLHSLMPCHSVAASLNASTKVSPTFLFYAVLSDLSFL